MSDHNAVEAAGLDTGGRAEAAVAQDGGDLAAAGFRAQPRGAVDDVRVEIDGDHAAVRSEDVREEFRVSPAGADFEHGHARLQLKLFDHVGL